MAFFGIPIIANSSTVTLILLALCVMMVTPGIGHASEMEEWINVRGETVRVFSSSVDKLLERGYLVHKVIAFESRIGPIEYTSKVDILDMDYNYTSITIVFTTTTSSAVQNMTMLIPRDVLDSTNGYDYENDAWRLDRFYVFIDKYEIHPQEIMTNDTARMISFAVPPNSTQFELVGLCRLDACHLETNH